MAVNKMVGILVLGALVLLMAINHGFRGVKVGIK